MNLTENEEKKHLARILQRLRAVLKSIDEMVEKQARDLLEIKKYLYENKTGMDRMEKFSVRQSVSWEAAMGEEAVDRKNRIHKLLDSPYFGRIDFSEGSSTHPQQIYIGIHSFFDEEKNTNIIHDWRAPVSSMFYDFETGEASYEAPGGLISGRITLKRQFRIRRGKMEYMIDNLSNVYDDILQKELSKSADDKMKHIVATIQRDQNAIVRNETSQVLIIQGVAGSGKTSIALHRIAFLLYRFKDSLKAGNILIISPNKVYADYIANVLPELGEERVPEAGMEEIAAKALENKYRFQTFYEQVGQLLEKRPWFIERIRFKASYELIASLDQFLVYVENTFFTATDIWLGTQPGACLVYGRKVSGTPQAAHHGKVRTDRAGHRSQCQKIL
jgi:DNA helicase II / ATP-dependent DNA helicase PcrA